MMLWEEKVLITIYIGISIGIFAVCYFAHKSLEEKRQFWFERMKTFEEYTRCVD